MITSQGSIPLKLLLSDTCSKGEGIPNSNRDIDSTIPKELAKVHAFCKIVEFYILSSHFQMFPKSESHNSKFDEISTLLSNSNHNAMKNYSTKFNLIFYAITWQVRSIRTLGHLLSQKSWNLTNILVGILLYKLHAP